MTHRERVVATADQFGWTIEDGSLGFLIFTKAVPMIERRDEHRLCVQFNDADRAWAAFYGPNRHSHDLAAPLVNAVIDHLVRFA
jgi:hypothetical protein